MVRYPRRNILKLTAFIIILIFIFSMLNGCIDDVGDQLFYTYQLDIFPENETAQYEILLPIPINEMNQVDENFIQNAIITLGTLNLEVNETPFGPALSVNGTGDAQITFDFFSDEIDAVHAVSNLSLQREFREEEDLGLYRIHSTLDNVSLHIEYQYDESGDEWFTIEFEMITILNAGWQDVLATINEW
jgi:hypothetical protein